MRARVCVRVCVCCTPGRGEPLRLRVRAARRELAVAAVGEDPRLRTVPVQHARAAPARLARSHPRARARRRRKRRRRPATRATSLGRAGVHAVGGPTGKGPRKVACQCPWRARPLLAPGVLRAGCTARSTSPPRSSCRRPGTRSRTRSRGAALAAATAPAPHPRGRPIRRCLFRPSQPSASSTPAPQLRGAVLPVHAEQRLEGCRRAGLPPPVQVEEGDA